ncbi:MAG: molybdopterin-dependent oxidoreductase, partial [Blastocatellia bacterium]
MNKKPSRRAASRRRFLSTAGQTGAAIALSHITPVSMEKILASVQQKIKGKERLIVRSLRPEDLETPVELFTSWLTPIDLFYVRHHFYAPQVNPGEWKLVVDGEVNTPLSLSLDDLKKLPRVSVTVTLECAGNGRSFYDPPVAGIQWEKGAVGTAKWSGARLADVLKKAGVKPAGKWIWLNGADKGVGTAPDFIRQAPLDKAMHPDTILAYEMNDQPLPHLHGQPLRAVLPGWEGAYAVKWLNHITVSPKETEEFFVKTAYRYPTKRVAPGAAVPPQDMA